MHADDTNNSSKNKINKYTCSVGNKKVRSNSGNTSKMEERYNLIKQIKIEDDNKKKL